MIERAEAVIRVETEVDELLFGDLAYGWMGLLDLDRCQLGVLVRERAGHLPPSYSRKQRGSVRDVVLLGDKRCCLVFDKASETNGRARLIVGDADRL